MKWELVIINEPGTPLPTSWVPGGDRLDWVSPYPGVREKLEENIALGKLSRYIEHDDRVENTPEGAIAHTIFNTLEAAEEMKEWYSWKATVVACEIIERPDLP